MGASSLVELDAVVSFLRVNGHGAAADLVRSKFEAPSPRAAAAAPVLSSTHLDVGTPRGGREFARRRTTPRRSNSVPPRRDEGDDDASSQSSRETAASRRGGGPGGAADDSMLLRAQSARRQMRLAQALSPRANDEGSGRFSLESPSLESSSLSVASASSARSPSSTASAARREPPRRANSVSIASDDPSAPEKPVELKFSTPKLGFSLELRRDARDDARLVVTAVRDSCEHAFALTTGFELVSVNGAAVPAKLSDRAFQPMLQRLAAAPRPIRLGFSRRPDPPPPNKRQMDALARSIPAKNGGGAPPPPARPPAAAAPPPPPPPAKPAPPAAPTPLALTFESDRLGFVLSNDPAHGRAIVSKVRETCEHLATLRQGDELATVNGATVPSPLRNSDFDSLLKIIKAAARPLHLSFARRPPGAKPPPPRPAPPRPRAATAAAAPAAPAAPAKRADEDAERSWEDFIKQQRLEHVG